MIPNQPLIDYIKSQLANNISKDQIVKVLLESQHTQQQVDEAFSFIEQPVVSATPTPVTVAPVGKSKRKLFIPLVLISILLAGGMLAYVVMSTRTFSENEVPDVATESEQQEISGDCRSAYDLGYLKGLTAADINDNEGAPIEITEECKTTHDHGYEEGKISAESQLKESYDFKRKADVTAIAEAVYQYAAANNGNVPKGITVTPQEIGLEKLNIISDLQKYMANDVPFDPLTGTPESTGYTIYRSAEGRVIVEAASSVEENEKISATR